MFPFNTLLQQAHDLRLAAKLVNGTQADRRTQPQPDRSGVSRRWVLGLAWMLMS